MRSRIAVVSLAGACALAACADVTPTAPAAADDIRALQEQSGPDIVTVPRFELQLTPTGSMRPGQPIEIKYEVRALLESSVTEVAVRLPEVEAAKLSGWSGPFMAQAGEVPAAARVRRSLAAGEVVTGTLRLTIPAPGYYRVVLTAVAVGAKVRDTSGRLVLDNAQVEQWLLVDEQGGTVTRTFEPGRIAKAVRAVPGPFVRPAELAARPGPLRTEEPVAGNVVRIYPRWYKSIPGQYMPVADSGVTYIDTYYEEVDDYAGQTVGSGWTSTQGPSDVPYLEFNCPSGDYQTTYYTFYARINQGTLVFDPTPQSGISVTQYDCGHSFTVVFQAEPLQVMSNVAYVANLSTQLFGRSRSTLYINLDYTSGGWSSYLPGSGQRNDAITFWAAQGSSHVWGLSGLAVAAHEYGHAVHHRAIGNYPMTSCSTHYMDVAQATTCAWKEGFADFHEAITVGSQTGSASAIENNAYYRSGADGNNVEGPIASMLYDMADGANETHDQFAGSAKYVGDVIATCSVRLNGSLWVPNSEASHFVYCAENGVDPAIRNSYFLSSPARPDAERESATEPLGYSIAAVRSVWKRNLYNQ